MTFDHNFKFKKNSETCHCCFYHIRYLRCVC